MQISQTTQNKAYTIEQLKEKLAPIFINTKVQKAVVFGSYANGNATASSDIDIVIDSKSQLKGFDFFSVVADIEDALEKPVDVYEAHYLPDNSVVTKAVNAGSVIIYER